jgi:hypothetical protein
MEPIEQPNPLIVVPIWPPILDLESLQLVQVVMPPPEVVVVLVLHGMPRILSWEVLLASTSFF